MPLHLKLKTKTHTHIAALLAVFTDLSLNAKWNAQLAQQTPLFSQNLNKQLVRHVYNLPWPIVDREFLIHCNTTVDQQKHTFVSTCSSVDDEQVPVTDGRIRATLHRSVWAFTAMPDGTQIDFESSIDPHGDLPSWIVSAGQQIGREKLVIDFLKLQEKLKVPPLQEYLHWGDNTLGQQQFVGRGIERRTPFPRIIRSLFLEFIGKTTRSLSGALRDVQNILEKTYEHEVQSFHNESFNSVATEVFLRHMREKLDEKFEVHSGAGSTYLLLTALIAGSVMGLFGRALPKGANCKQVEKIPAITRATLPCRSLSHAHLATLLTPIPQVAPRRCSSQNSLSSSPGFL